MVLLTTISTGRAFRLRLGVKLAMAVQMSQQFTSAQGLQGQSVERGAGPRSITSTVRRCQCAAMTFGVQARA